ncbi:MAG: hypothetical protein GY866_01145 [Proteobacteria bacterium]|nr:hypothetical protein [Pseudomonadota bacterium]
MDEMKNLHRQLLQCSDIESVRQALLDDGWQYLNEGDWAWIYLAPDTRLIARLCTFDPAYRLYLDCCLENSYEIHLPTIALLHDMPHGSYVALMEYYQPFGSEKAKELSRLLSISSSRDLPEHLNQLHAILSTLFVRAKEKLFQFGSFDLRPDHIVMNGRGQFVVLDPIYVDGRKLIRSMQNDLVSVVAHHSVEELLNFLKIAVMAKKPDDPLTIQLRKKLLLFRA